MPFNSFIFRYRSKLLKWSRIIINIVSIEIIGLLIFRYGFPEQFYQFTAFTFFVRFFYIVFILNFGLRLYLSPEKSRFLIRNIFESILVTLILIDGVSFFIIGHPLLESVFVYLNVPDYTGIYNFSIQFFLLLFALLEIIRSINSLYRTSIKPTSLFIFSFIVLILTGAGLLMLPGFNNHGVLLNFTDALFTSASASCVTGLTVVNTATFFNFKGQVIIMLLIQLGGIGILTFASFFASFIKKGIGVKHQLAMNEILDSENFLGASHMIKRILLMTFLFEFLGFIGIYMLWGDYPFHSEGQRIYYSVFHSISAFCNAGFSIFDGGFETPFISELYMLHIFMGVIIFFGGLGFPANRDLFSPNLMKMRLKEPWRDWKLSTRIALFTSVILVLLGTVAFYVLEVRQNPDLTNKPLGQFAAAFFQSVNTRTSGFNTISLSGLSPTLLLISIFLMFIGASSASTGGGIKTSTFVVMMTAVIGTIKGKNEFTLGRRSIHISLVYKAFAVVIFSGLLVLLFITFLSFTEPGIPLINLAYETVSAFATVGLSTGITSNLQDSSKIILTIAMFIGRVGIITLAFSLSTRGETPDFRYTQSHLMIG